MESSQDKSLPIFNQFNGYHSIDIDRHKSRDVGSAAYALMPALKSIGTEYIVYDRLYIIE